MHIQKYIRPLLAVMLALALSLSPALQVSAATTTEDGVTTYYGESDPGAYNYKDSVKISYLFANAGQAISQKKEATFRTTHPVAAYYTNEGKAFVTQMFDPDNRKVVSFSESDIYCQTGTHYKVTNGEAIADKVVHNISWHDTKYWVKASEFWQGSLGDAGTILEFTGLLFKDEASFNAYVENGDTSGLIHFGEDSEEDEIRDFSTEYDPSVPVPKLSNITFSGFHVDNAADDLELDAVVKSSTHDINHMDYKIGINPNQPLFMFGVSRYNHHYKDLTSSYEVGYYKSDYNLAKDFKYDLAQILADDASAYFVEHPNHSNLPDYDGRKHNRRQYTDQYLGMKAPGSSNEEYLSRTLTGYAAYYVRFYKLDYKTGTMTPGQWQCYQFWYDYDGKRVTTSPVEGDSEGNPTLTDPQPGREDDDGNIEYNPPEFDTDLTGIIGNLTGILEALTDFFGDFPRFLEEAFVFVPSYIWQIIGVGFTVIIVTAFFKMLK